MHGRIAAKSPAYFAEFINNRNVTCRLRHGLDLGCPQLSIVPTEMSPYIPTRYTTIAVNYRAMYPAQKEVSPTHPPFSPKPTTSPLEAHQRRRNKSGGNHTNLLRGTSIDKSTINRYTYMSKETGTKTKQRNPGRRR